MASSDQIKNMALRNALIKRLHDIDQTMSHFEHPNEEVDNSSDFEEEDCYLRKRKTKKIGKGLNLKTSKRKLNRDYRDNKRVKESRSRKRTKRSPTQAKGERDYGILLQRVAENIIGEQKDCAQSKESELYLIGKINKEIMAMVASW
jgi:hypothetical protein